MYQDKSNKDELKPLCIDCGGSKLTESIKEQQFPYGTSTNQVILTASMPVITCADCGYEFFDERGEVARHVSVCRYLGIQTPEEIRSIREKTRLSRTEFCQITGFGSASLQRWETGGLFPNASSDRLIFLLRYADNVERLKRRGEVISQGLLPHVVKTADPLVNITDRLIPQAHTQCGIKRFTRLEGRFKTVSQSVAWTLRRAQCTS